MRDFDESEGNLFDPVFHFPTIEPNDRRPLEAEAEGARIGFRVGDKRGLGRAASFH
jgi:hypothetical protein